METTETRTRSKAGEALMVIGMVVASAAILITTLVHVVTHRPLYPYVGRLMDGTNEIAIPRHLDGLKVDIRSPEMRSGVLLPPADSKFKVTARRKDVVEGGVVFSTWAKSVSSSVQQVGPSCCGYAWGNWMSMMLRKAGCGLGDDERIDGYAIWRKGREMFWGGGNGGLYLSQGFLAAQELGIIPKEAKLVEVSNDPVSISHALMSTPIIVGSILDEGWDEPSLENGCLDHREDIDVGDGAHATVMIGIMEQKGQIFYLSLNSWGEWGWHGMFVATEQRTSDMMMLDGPYAVEMPKGWESDKGWKKHIVKVGFWD